MKKKIHKRKAKIYARKEVTIIHHDGTHEVKPTKMRELEATIDHATTQQEQKQWNEDIESNQQQRSST